MVDFIQTLEDRIMEWVRHPDYQPLKQHELARALRVPDGQRRDVRRALASLEKAGKLTRVRKNRWATPQGAQVVEGVLMAHRDGFGFVTLDEPDKEDIFIPARAMNGALHGDRVQVELGAKRAGRRSTEHAQPSGSILRVLERRRERIAGVWKKTRYTSVLIPQDPRMPATIPIKEVAASAKSARSDHAVVIELLPPSPDQTTPIGRIVEDLGPAGAPGVDMACLLLNHDLSAEFPDEVMKKVNAISPTLPRSEEGRRDLRKDLVLTIDPEDARDFDDAISLTRADDKKNWLLTVHIADVSAYVERGSEIDREALHRGNSVYLVDRVITMLPRHLTEKVCSLNPKEDRLVHSVRMLVTQTGVVRNVETFPALIHSAARLTYEPVQKLLDDGTVPDGLSKPLTEMLKNMSTLSQALRKRRAQEGAILFSMPEVRCQLDAQGITEAIVPRVAFDAYQLIEEFMLLANRSVARLISDKKKYSAIYRIHDAPDSEGWERIAEDLAMLGIKDHPTTRQDLNAIAVAEEGAPRAHIVNIAILRNLKRAVYSGHRSEHFGLAFSHYLHFTSPIRRYADLIAHRVLKALEQDAPPPYSRKELETIAAQLTRTEREAADAEAESIDIKRVEYFARQLKEGNTGPYKAVVTSVIPKGLMIELIDSLQKGLLSFSFMKDSFQANVARNRATSRRSKKSWQIGDTLDVELVRVDERLRRLDFRVAGTKQGGTKSSDEPTKKRGGSQKRRGQNKKQGQQRKRGQRSK